MIARTHIEYTAPTQQVGNVTPERLKAALRAMRTQEDPNSLHLLTFSRIASAAAAQDLELVNTDIHFEGPGEGHCFILLNDPLEALVSPEFEQFEETLKELLPGFFIEVTFSGDLSQQGEFEEPKARLTVHRGLEGGTYGISEMETFRAYLEHEIQQIVPNAHVVAEDQALVVEAHDSRELLWCLYRLPHRFPDLPISVQYQSLGVVDVEQEPDPEKLLRWGLTGEAQVFAEQERTYTIVPHIDKAADVKGLASAYRAIFKEEITLNVDALPDGVTSELGRHSTWVKYSLAPRLDQAGVVTSVADYQPPILRNDEKPPPETFFAKNWNLISRSSDLLSIAADDEHSSGDVAFGILPHLRSGGYTIRGDILNTARISPVGGKYDQDLGHFGGSLYDIGLPLYPKAVRERYFALSTKFVRPQLQMTIELDRDFEIRDVFLSEGRGVIDYAVTFEEFGNHPDQRVKNQYRLAEEVAAGLNAKGERRKRIYLSDNTNNPGKRVIEELHVLLYEAAGIWMSKFEGIAVPYRTSHLDIPPNIQRKIDRLYPEGRNSGETVRERLFHAFQRADSATRSSLIRNLGKGGYSLSPNGGHELLGAPHFIRVGAGVRIDLNRIAQHQLTASLGGLPALSHDVVERRVQLGTVFEVEKNLRIDEIDMLRELFDNTIRIGSMNAGVVSTILEKGMLLASREFSHPIHIPLHHTHGRTWNKGDRVQFRIEGFSFVHRWLTGSVTS